MHVNQSLDESEQNVAQLLHGHVYWESCKCVCAVFESMTKD